MLDDALWASLDPDPLLVRRDNASKLRRVAHQMSNLQAHPYLLEGLARTLHEVALELEVAREPQDELASVTAARKALQDLRAALPHIGEEIDLAIKISREQRDTQRRLNAAVKTAAKARASHLSTIKEARRQAARALAAEAELSQQRRREQE